MLMQIIHQTQSESRKKCNVLSEKPLDRYGPSDHPVGACKIKISLTAENDGCRHPHNSKEGSVDGGKLC